MHMEHFLFVDYLETLFVGNAIIAEVFLRTKSVLIA